MDALKWNQAQLQASRGEQVLLSKVLEVVRAPSDIIQGDGKHAALVFCSQCKVDIRSEMVST